MKRTEIAMIILISSLSMLLTFTLMRTLLGERIEQSAVVKEAVEISDQIEQPAKRVFNSKAINPTVEVCVQTNGETAVTPGDVATTETTSQACGGSATTTESNEATEDGAAEAVPTENDN